MYGLVFLLSAVAQIPQMVDPNRPPFPEAARAPAEQRPVREFLTDADIRQMRKEQAAARTRAAILARYATRLDRRRAAIPYRMARAKKRYRRPRPTYRVPLARLAAAQAALEGGPK